MITAIRTTPLLRIAVLAIAAVASFAVAMLLTRHGAAPHTGAIHGARQAIFGDHLTALVHGAKPAICYEG